MVTMGKRLLTEEIPANTKKMNTTNDEYSYEQTREQRIRENKERMQKLGILDLSSKLKSDFLPPKRSPRYTPERRTPKHSTPVPSSEPRRSSRLQSVTPVSYTEPRLKKGMEDGEEYGKELIKEGERPEIYTEEHEKKLGTCKAPWTLYVDGIGTDGKRIYDAVKGKTCHQCRQKTLGHRTHCSICNLVQGQFCGDCLYTRYGENVLEANQNPDWICPVCRGICNCSLCRLAKGWMPTGYMYRKVEKLGYKSVAHYLIQTLRTETNSEEKVNTKDPISAKRSIPFNDAEDSPQQIESLDSTSNGKALAGSTEESSSQQKETLNLHENSKQLSEDNKDDDHIEEKKAEPENGVGKPEVKIISPKTNPKIRKSPRVTTPNLDTIVGRLRHRRTIS
ncbi:hypothetical protein MKX01_024787 [Papaver californicum]|nr:hypothetical protein MKX01_024787 [Papaver californicum]